MFVDRFADKSRTMVADGRVCLWDEHTQWMSKQAKSAVYVRTQCFELRSTVNRIKPENGKHDNAIIGRNKLFVERVSDVECIH